MACAEREEKHVICNVCDNYCPLTAELEQGRLVGLRPYEDPKAICYKAHSYKEYISHPDRILYPMKNLGRRGEQRWVRISWDQALGEIASKLQEIIARYGPESLAVSSLVGNCTGDQGMIRRFMNVLGSPNFISGVHMCAGNTFQVHRVTFGTTVGEDFETANCILLVGHNPHKGNWAGQAAQIDAALQRGAKLIVLDPRKSENAARAHIHLPLRYGTDAAMLLGFLHVILEEKLYDPAFVAQYTYGFEQLKARAAEYPLSKVAAITGCRAEEIAAAARMFATSGPSIIPWGPIPDMQVNSTSAIRCQDILMSVCGFVGKCEVLQCPMPNLVSVSELELHEQLSPAQKAKQLGGAQYPLLSYQGYEQQRGPVKRIYGIEWLDLQASFMANPAAVFRAMAEDDPYPVRAFLNLGSNALMGYVNQQRVFDGLMRQELTVVFDHWMTPTAQLADYFLPADYFLERAGMLNDDSAAAAMLQQRVLEPRGECRSLYAVLKGLAQRMGLGAWFPWEDDEALLDYRVQKGGKRWRDIEGDMFLEPSGMVDPLKVGFATPTGKIELYSTVLEKLGCDPLPYYREPAQSPVSTPELAREYPLTVFVGLRDKANYLTNLRQIKSLRTINPYPEVYMHPQDIRRAGVENGQWVWVETTHGRMMLRVLCDEVQPEGTIRVPHGWWIPEWEGGLETGLSGAMLFNDGMILPDDDWNTDREQGVPNLRGGLLAKVYGVGEENLPMLASLAAKKAK